MDTIANPDRYGFPFGIPACPQPLPEDLPPEAGHLVWMPWNALIGEGLVAYGFRTQAADLVRRLMGAIVNALKSEHSFRIFYHATAGTGAGERNALGGLPPLGLFLRTLGVHLHSPWKVALDGTNPFPWPVEVKYKGLSILRGVDETRIQFPDGQTATIDTAEPCIVEREKRRSDHIA